MTETGYECKECGKPAAIADGKVVRSCEHSDKPVLAVMTVVVTGEGTTEQG